MSYQLYADDSETSSKVANVPEQPSLGRIRVDSITPQHSPLSIKRCISRVERNPTLVNSDLFAGTTCDALLKEGHISTLRTDGPGLSRNNPMAIVQADVQVESPLPVTVASIPNGRYVINKNRAAELYWSAPINLRVYFFNFSTKEEARTCLYLQVNPNPNLSNYFYDQNFLPKWDVTNDTNGNISMTSPYTPSSWVGAELIGSAVPVPRRLISADSKSY